MPKFNSGRLSRVSYDMESEVVLMNSSLLGHIKIHLCVLYFEWIFDSCIDYPETIVL